MKEIWKRRILGYDPEEHKIDWAYVGVMIFLIILAIFCVINFNNPDWPNLNHVPGWL